MTKRNSDCRQHRRFLVLLTATTLVMMAGLVLSWIELTSATEIRFVAAYPGAQQQQQQQRRHRGQMRVRRQRRRHLQEKEEEEEEELPQADDPEEISMEQDKEQQDKEQDKNNAEQDKEQDKNNVEQDKNNVEPDNVVTTEQPQLTPTDPPIVQQPTNFPTQQPQVTPTPAPIQPPQATPTSDPVPAPTTQQPTVAPTVRPTNSPTTSSSSSGQEVTTTPTFSPTRPPTTAPTTSSPSEPEVIGIVIPKITIDVVVSDEEGTSASALPSEIADSMEVRFLLFLDKILQESSDPYNFDYSHIEASVTVSTTLDDNEDTRRRLVMTTTTTIRKTRRRRMAESYRIELDGTAYFGSNPPTPESLEQSLVVYFSFWGTSDVDEYLQESGLTNADVSSVVVGDKKIVAMSPDEEEILAGDVDGQNANSQSDSTSSGEDGSENTNGSESSEEEEDNGINWIMAIAGLTPAILAPFVLFACVKYHLRQKRKKEEEKEKKTSTNESQSQTEEHGTSKGDVSIEKKDEDEERPDVDI